jgi:hypothetical protein
MKKLNFKNKQRTGNLGLFYIGYKLSRFGWNVLPTIKNAKAIDMMAYNEKGDKISIQCKGFTNTESVGPFKDIEDIIADYYIISTNVYRKPVTYILTKDDVRNNMTKNKNGYWLEKSRKKDNNFYLKDEFREKWDKIGYGYLDINEREQIVGIDKETMVNQ